LSLPPIGPRIDRLVSAVETIRALWSPEAATPPGITRSDPFYPLHGAVNAPAPYTPGGPPIYLGGQGPRGSRLPPRRAARRRARLPEGEARRAAARARGRGRRRGRVRHRRPGVRRRDGREPARGGRVRQRARRDRGDARRAAAARGARPERARCAGSRMPPA